MAVVHKGVRLSPFPRRVRVEVSGVFWGVARPADSRGVDGRLEGREAVIRMALLLA